MCRDEQVWEIVVKCIHYCTSRNADTVCPISTQWSRCSKYVFANIRSDIKGEDLQCSDTKESRRVWRFTIARFLMVHLDGPTPNDLPPLSGNKPGPTGTNPTALPPPHPKHHQPAFLQTWPSFPMILEPEHISNSQVYTWEEKNARPGPLQGNHDQGLSTTRKWYLVDISKQTEKGPMVLFFEQ